jgi:hypothetical protein
MLSHITLLCVLLAQVTLLVLQAAMLRRYHHRCFLLLLLGSASGVIYSLVSLVIGLVQFRDGPRLLLFQASSAIVVLGVIVGVWGTVSLFRSYGLLRQGGSA